MSDARRRWLALGVLCASLLAIVIDNTIVNVALPTLVRDLDADVSELQWVVDAYTLVFAGLLLLAGTLGDRFGRRRTLLSGLAVFGLASAAAAFAGGVDLLIAAGAMIVFAPLSSKLVLRFGTKRVTTTGMLLFSAGLAVAATVSASTGYGRLAMALVLMGVGMGLAGAPATESIMGSLPGERANIGSAVNDTTRELGGALGVAIVGSIMSSLYSTQLANALPEGVPAPVGAAARESLGVAVQISAAVADPAREAFVHAMSRASILVALAAVLGAFIAWRHLPSHAGDQIDRSPGADDGPHVGARAAAGELLTLTVTANRDGGPGEVELGPSR